MYTPKNIFNFFKRKYYQTILQKNKQHALFYINNCRCINSVLKSDEEIQESLNYLKILKLTPRDDKPKNWDCLRAFSFILKHGNSQSHVLDVGSADYGTILPWLELYGLTNLYACDLSFERDFTKGHIHYYKQDLEQTTFPLKFFDFITSLSVIEHGVNIDAYFKEMTRLLKDGGYLLTSTDYWPEPIDTTGIYPYGKQFGEMKIFTKKDIETMLEAAKVNNLELIAPIDFSFRSKVVHWQRVNRSFTFMFFILTKIPK